MAGILCAVWNKNAKHFVPAKTSGSLSCSKRDQKAAFFHSKGFVALGRGQFGVFQDTDL